MQGTTGNVYWLLWDSFLLLILTVQFTWQFCGAIGCKISNYREFKTLSFSVYQFIRSNRKERNRHSISHNQTTILHGLLSECLTIANAMNTLWRWALNTNFSLTMFLKKLFWCFWAFSRQCRTTQELTNFKIASNLVKKIPLSYLNINLSLCQCTPAWKKWDMTRQVSLNFIHLMPRSLPQHKPWIDLLTAPVSNVLQ